VGVVTMRRSQVSRRDGGEEGGQARLRASDTRELVLQDAIVPKENVLGALNNGFAAVPPYARRRSQSAWGRSP